METSTSADAQSIVSHFGLLSTATLVCAGAAALILLWYLVYRPPLRRGTRVLLLLGFGVLPIGAAFTGNVATFEHTKTRAFCGSCHVMTPYTNDSADPNSTTLAARHARNPYFGGENCYVCHADYGMYGTVTTKLSGMKHVWYYYTGWNALSIEQALERIEIARPFRNQSCMQCHSTTGPSWLEQDEHAAMLEDLRSGAISCASEGCHGPAHPFSKEARRRAGEEHP